MLPAAGGQAGGLLLLSTALRGGCARFSPSPRVARHTTALALPPPLALRRRPAVLNNPAPSRVRPHCRTVWAARQLLSRPSLARLPAGLRAAGPSAAGLALIPLVVPHVDEAVERTLEAQLRPHLHKARAFCSVVPGVPGSGRELLTLGTPGRAHLAPRPTFASNCRRRTPEPRHPPP